MSFEGTRFEKLAKSIKSEVNRKRKSFSNNNEINTRKKKKGTISVGKNAEETNPSRLFQKDEPIPEEKKETAAVAVDNEAANVYANERTVYLQGLPYAATEEDVTDFFKQCGVIISIRLPRWHDSGKLKGYGHVEFKRKDGATKALELSGQYLLDRYLTIDRPQVPRAASQPAEHVASEKPAGCRSIFIKNLPYEISEAEITEQFRVFGPIKSIRLAMWNHTGKLKGIGYIDYKKEESAEIAVKKTGTINLKGRRIIVDYETGAPKAGFKGNK